MVKNKKVRKTKIIALTAAVLLLAGGSAFAYVKTRHPAAPAPLPVGGVNLDKPTAEEIKETEEFKKQQAKATTNPPTQTASNNNANVVITTITTTEARGYVSGTVEEGGTCTLTLTRGTAKVTASSTGILDVNKTTCSQITIGPGQLSSGEWDAVLSYTSPSISGSSAVQKLKVP